MLLLVLFLRLTEVAAFGAHSSPCASARHAATQMSHRTLKMGTTDVASYGFYTDFNPLSYASTQDEDEAAFSQPLGYEPALMRAVSEFTGGKLEIEYKPIPNPFDGIWLKAADADYDVVGGGVTITQARTKDQAGNHLINFGTGHVAFRQSLLVETDSPVQTHADLTPDHLVAALPGTTGELRLLQLLGLVDDEFIVAPDTAIHVMRDGQEVIVIADGTDKYVISGDERTSASLQGRLKLVPPGKPSVTYKGSEQAQLDALIQGEVDAVARGELGNVAAANESARFEGFLAILWRPAVLTLGSRGNAYGHHPQPHDKHDEVFVPSRRDLQLERNASLLPQQVHTQATANSQCTNVVEVCVLFTQTQIEQPGSSQRRGGGHVTCVS